MKVIFKNMKDKEWILLGLIILDVIGQVALELKMPEYTAKLTQIVTYNHGSIDMGEVWYNGGMMIACAFGSLALALLNAFFISTFSSGITRSIRDKFFTKVSKLSLAEINQFETSSLITRTTNDVVQVQNFLGMGTGLLFRAPITAIWAITKISRSHIYWTLSTVVAVLIILVVVILVVLLALPKFKKIQTLTDELNLRARENMQGVRVIRAFDANDYQTAKYEDTNDKVYHNNLFTSLVAGAMMPIITLVMEGLTLAIYYFGGYIMNETEMVNKSQVLADMTAFSSYALQVVMAFMMLIMIFMLLPRVLVSLKRINEVLDTKSSIKNGKKENEVHEGNIEFKNVCFSYSNDDKYTLSNINFTLNKGETLAIIGSTGSGKSTLANLINRSYDVTCGEILIDSMNIKDYKLADLNKRVSIAHQKANLFKGSVKSNICYGADNINEDRLNQVINTSNSRFIYDYDGLMTEVAQGATNFSGGQKQRLSIARTLYKDSDIYIFDDTFSALDFKTDSEVRKAIKENYRDKTVIIIAQRIGTVMNADKIMVLNDGKIDSIGTHEELLKTSKLYQEIALSQLDKEEL